MRRNLTFVCLLATTLAGMAQTATDTDWYTADPDASMFTISTDRQLAGLAALVNRSDNPVDFYNRVINLSEDIDLTEWLDTYGGTEGWIPIGQRYDMADFSIFSGIFNGHGHTISGLWINRPGEDNVGLFGWTEASAITNLRIEINNTGEREGVVGKMHVGALGGFFAGCDLTFCYVWATDSSRPAVRSTENITGGMAGYCLDTQVDLCHTYIHVDGQNTVGGLIGYFEGSTYGSTFSSATGNVNGVSIVGGLVGMNQDGSFSHCYATGNVNGDYSAGGLIGSLPEPAVLSFVDCYSSGAVTGANPSGGLIGVLANNLASFSDTFFNREVNPSLDKGGGTPDIAGVTGETTDQMKTEDTYTAAGWNFIGYWAIDSSPYTLINQGYPYFKWTVYDITFTIGDQVVHVNGSTVADGAVLQTDVYGLAFTVAAEDADTDRLVVTVTDADGNSRTLTDVEDIYTLYPVASNLTVTVALREEEAPEPQPTPYTVTLAADPGILLLPSAGMHAATIGNSFTFYITLAEGFEGRTPQATVNGDPVVLTLRPNGTEWMYVIPMVDEDKQVRVSFSTTANDTPDAPRFYSRDGRLFIETPQPLTLTIYTATGQQVADRRLPEGLTTIPLPPGFYILKTGNKAAKVIIKK